MICVTSFSSIPYCSNSEYWPLNLCRLCCFIWGTTLVKRRIPDQSTEPYPPTQTENRLGTQRSCSCPFRYIDSLKQILYYFVATFQHYKSFKRTSLHDPLKVAVLRLNFSAEILHQHLNFINYMTVSTSYKGSFANLVICLSISLIT